jgi:hypothetical protein
MEGSWGLSAWLVLERVWTGRKLTGLAGWSDPSNFPFFLQQNLKRPHPMLASGCRSRLVTVEEDLGYAFV